MALEDKVSIACKIMMDFASRTGVLGVEKPKRYLWTDAFAVCNFIALYKFTKDKSFLDVALKLVDQVHKVLGRHREDDSRSGWISGLSDREAEEHPTIGGLRIGKNLPERKPDEPLDMDLEWERDGQYYHYLTKWMHALNKVYIVTGDAKYNRWAMELAKKAHSAFTYTSPDGKRRMYWKMSIDLTRPLVNAMGQHDPLDGYITYNELQALSPKDNNWPNLNEEIEDITKIMIEEGYWVTDDPLGIGELLSYAYRLFELINLGYTVDIELLMKILRSAYTSLEIYMHEGLISLPANRRLAFREFGLSIGLKASMKMKKFLNECLKDYYGEISSIIKLLQSYFPIAEKIESFWLKDVNRRVSTWREHRDINEVMLVTSLIPDGYVGIRIEG